MADDRSRVSPGETVFDEDGTSLGTVRGFDEDGFYVTLREGMDALSVAHEHTVAAYGEAELLWRCSNCGEVGDVHDVPEACPSCGAERERIYYWTED